MRYEFHAYPADESGSIASTATVSVDQCSTESAAMAKAGRLAKSLGGPVDLAREGSEDWGQRYVTTAAPSAVHAKGYFLERLT